MPTYTRQTNMFGDQKTTDPKKYAEIAFHLKQRFENWFQQFLGKLLKDGDYSYEFRLQMLQSVYGGYSLDLAIKKQCYLHLMKGRIKPHTDEAWIRAQDRTFIDYVLGKFVEQFPFVTEFTRFNKVKKTYTYNSKLTKVNYYFDVDTYHMEETGSKITGINEKATFVETIMKDAGYHVMTAPNDTMKYDEFEKLALPMRGKLKPDDEEITLYPKYSPTKKKKFYYKDGGTNMKPVAIKTIYNLYRKGVMSEI